MRHQDEIVGRDTSPRLYQEQHRSDLVKPVVARGGREVALDRVGAAGYTCTAVFDNARLRIEVPSYTFWMQLRGTSRIESAEGEFHLGRGDWIAFDRESLPEMQADRNGLTLGISFTFATFLRGRVGENLFLHPGFGNASQHDLRLWTRLWGSCARQDVIPSRNANGKLRALQLHMHMLQRTLEAEEARCPGRSTYRKAQIFTRLQRVRMCLEGNPHRVVHAEELIRFAQCSTWWLSKTYREVYGESPQQACVRIRMNLACRLLRHTRLSISELGGICGFTDPCSFARQFKSYHGMTASEWREALRHTDGGYGVNAALKNESIRSLRLAS